MKLILTFVVALLLNQTVMAVHLGTYSLNLPGAETTENIEFRIVHRFYGPIDNQPLQNLFGMDAGANTALGLAFALRGNWDMSITRATLNKEYYVATKVKLFDGTALLLGLTDQTIAPPPQNKTNYVGQLIVTRTLIDDLLHFSLVPSYTNPQANNPTLALGSALNWQPQPGWEITLEYTPVVSGFTLAYPNASAGLKIKTWGHYFTLIVTNTFQTLPNNYLTGSANNRFGFGFNIIRNF